MSNYSPTYTEEQNVVCCRMDGLLGCLQPFSLYRKDSKFDDVHKEVLHVKKYTNQ